jgi:hypothetical protein
MTALHALHQDTAAVARRLADLSHAIVEGETTTGDDLISTALRLVCDLVPAARWASVTHVAKQPETLAASDERALALDEAQYRSGVGPCLTALEDRTVVVSDFATEQRWAEFIAHASTDGVAAGSLSISLAAAGHAATSLNLYADARGRWDDAELEVAMLAAAGLALVLTAVAQRDRTHHLEVALSSSRVIGAAVGVLMTRHGWTYDQAFDALRRTIQHGHRKLRDIADDVVLMGTLPE